MSSEGHGHGPKLVTFDFSPHWFFLPPVVAVFTLIAARLFSSGVVITVDPAMWGLAILMFTVLTILYAIYINRGFTRGLFAAQVAAQGFLLCPLALRMGSTGMAWVGVVMAICGAVVLVAFYYFRLLTSSAAASQAEQGPEIDSLPSPFAITDGDGTVISVSDLMLSIAQKNRMSVSGTKITALLPIDRETVTMGGKDWRILQSPMPDGTYYFQLEEVHEAAPVPSEDREGFFDKNTSLYNRSYVAKRVEEELYRIYRYKRWMSAALIRMYFVVSPTSFGPNAQKEEEIFNAYCRFAKDSTRETDILCNIAARDVLVVMPETELDGAQNVVSKLMDFSGPLQEILRTYDNKPAILEASAFFNASTGVLDFDRLMEKMNEALKGA